MVFHLRLRRHKYRHLWTITIHERGHLAKLRSRNDGVYASALKRDTNLFRDGAIAIVHA